VLTEGNDMAITIDRKARDALYEEILTELSGSGDVWTEMQSGDYEAARRTRRRLEDDMRLLDDIGWEPEQDRETFELSMPPADLARALQVLNDNVAATIHGHVVQPIDEAHLVQRAVVVQTACGAVFAQIADNASTGGEEAARG
jgi:hypothetical protein